MARIQTPQDVQELQARFKVREAFGLELLETIQPTYQMGAQKVASTGFPRTAFGIVSAAAGGAGTNLECGIRCPPNRGIILLVEKVVLLDLGAQVSFRMTDGVAMTPISATPASKAFRDGRLVGLIPDAILEVANPLTAAPNGQNVGAYSTIADDVKEIALDVILGDDAYFAVRHSTANTALTVNYFWTEFLLEDR